MNTNRIKYPPNPPAPEVGVPEVVIPEPPYTVLLDICACALTRANQDQKFFTGVFMDDFEICKDMPNEYRADIFKNFSGMAATQGQIRIMPRQNNKIKSFTK